MKTDQVKFWEGEFGAEYSKRNSYNYESWNNWYVNNFGIAKETINAEFLNTLDKDVKILEMGCNVGQQLYCLQKMGFTNLFGVELQSKAAETAKKQFDNLNIVVGSGFDLPFKDNFFDVVFTNGVLIHIAPENLKNIMSEMIRCTKTFIWGFEYFSEEVQEIPYRGNNNVLWKANYAQMLMNLSPQLEAVKIKDFPYISKEHIGNTDRMYLLQKK